MRVLLALGAVGLVVACDRTEASRADSRNAPARAAPPAVAAAAPAIPPDSYLFLDTMPTVVADDVAVTTLDSTGLGGIPMCAPLENVNFVFRHAVGLRVYCAEDGCDSPFPAKIALTRAGDTLRFESSPISSEIDRDGRPLVHYAYTNSPRIRGPLGAHAGMSVGELLALGETVDVDPTEASVVVMDTDDDARPDTLREGPNVLRLHLRRQALVAEVSDSVGRFFTSRLLPGRPAREALDTAARIAAIGVARDRCR